MNIERELCTPEQAKRLREFGVLQVSDWDWIYGRKNSVAPGFVSSDVAYYDEGGAEIACAFSVGELGIMLGLEPDGNSPKALQTDYYSNLIDTLKKMEGMTEANLRATLLLKALEKGNLSVIEVNNRLNKE